MNITEKAKGIIDSCRFCWMCRHICPVGNATGQERNTARARALAASLVVRGAEKIDEIIDNVYECTLCGACTNNCVTGWDPKVFIRELKTSAIMEGVIPEYIQKLLETYQASGNVYGKKACECLDNIGNAKADTLLYVGTDAMLFAPEAVKNAVTLLNKAGVDVAYVNNASDSGEELYFLTGKTEETRVAMTECAKLLNNYKKVIVYDPMDLKLFLHEYKEWDIAISAQIVGYHAFILELIENGKLAVKKSANDYTIQDHYAYARELDDVDTGRKIISAIGNNKEMLLIGKEANMAGSLLMNEYMPEVMTQIAEERWLNAKNMGCATVVTVNPSEYVLLKKTAKEGYRVVTMEDAVLENL